MKNLMALLIFLLPLVVNAQQTHTVGPKESLYSIGRMYNVHPKELASYNNIPLDKGLTIGQVIKIPSTTKLPPVAEILATAPVVKKEVPKKEVPKAEPVKTTTVKGTAPVYHTVAKKEGLYSISKNYGVSIDDIKKWNKLSSDALTEGMKLVVGYSGAAVVAETKVTTEKNEPVIIKTPEPKTVVEEPVKKAVVAPAKEVVVVPAKQEAVNKGSVDFNGGYFKSFYSSQKTEKTAIEEKGMAGIFKSTSGWDDGKYYCLHNTAPAGSYIKITNTATQKSVYAKVLDLIPDLKQNDQLIIRISNAAAAELGSGSSNFDCTLHF